MSTTTYSSNNVLNAVAAAAKVLDERKEEVNRLNVFPVPDGDTGTNMSLTIQSVVSNVANLPIGASGADIRKAVTTGALMGARGNSGVITSQILRGLCEGSQGFDEFDVESIAGAFERAREVAFQAVRKPVEGTILTVLRDSAAAAKNAAEQELPLPDALDAIVAEAYASVQRTPDLLPVLKEHGVDVVLCGSIGEHARQAVEGEHMLVFSGITGAADDVLERFLQGNLEAVDGDFAAGGSCGGCSGGCASGGCAGCSGCGGGAEREPYVETRTFTDIVTLTSENFQTEVLDDPGLILIDFWAEWCQPCRMLAPAFEELNREEPQVKFCRVNVDEQGELAQMFGIESIPTLAVVQDRHTLTGSVGLRSKEEIKAMLEGCK